MGKESHEEGRFYHEDGSWIERVFGNSFPWERYSASGELMQCYWTKEHCIEREPLQFTLGEGSMIPGFEQAVYGMKIGQSKTTTIPAEEAYGAHNDDLVLVFSREQLQAGLDPKVGQELQLQTSDGRIVSAPIIEVTEETVTVDANHPLAGKDLTFEIKLVEIN